jgi:hypothetical protein
MKTTVKTKLISIVLSLAIIVSILPLNAFASTPKYPFTVFGLESVEINAPSMNLNGNIGSTGAITVPSGFNQSNKLIQDSNLTMMYVGNKIENTHFSGNNVDIHNSDFLVQDLNIHVHNPIRVNGNLAFHGGNINPSSNLAIMATGNITLICETINANNNVIYSKNGDIEIEFPGTASLAGFVYAPHGTVTVTAQTVNLNGVVIIAKNVIINSQQPTNINDNNIAEFVGVDSEICDICNEEPTDVTDEPTICVGGTIEPPSANNHTNFINGNTADSSRASVDFCVLELIEETCVKANDIYGFEVVTWSPNTENRQATIEVNGVASPRFHGSTSAHVDRIWAIMSHGNTPNNGGRTEQNTLVYMNIYGSTTNILNHLVPLAPFVASETPTQFDVRIRTPDTHASLVTSISLLDENGEVLGTITYSAQNANGVWGNFVPANCTCNPTTTTSCLFGGQIAPPTTSGDGTIRIANGNGLAGTSGNDANRRVLNFDVQELIAGTAIQANEIYGIGVVTWGPNTQNRWVAIEVNGVTSPTFHGASAADSAMIWAVMEHGNTPNNGGRTEENTLTYMNQYGGNPQVASNVVPLAPFVSSPNAPFNVQIRALNDHFSIVTEVLLLDENEKVLGGVSYGGENNAWTRFLSFVYCGDCGFCADDDDEIDVESGLTYTVTVVPALNDESQPVKFATITGFGAGTYYSPNLVIPQTVDDAEHGVVGTDVR